MNFNEYYQNNIKDYKSLKDLFVPENDLTNVKHLGVLLNVIYIPAKNYNILNYERGFRRLRNNNDYKNIDNKGLRRLYDIASTIKFVNVYSDSEYYYIEVKYIPKSYWEGTGLQFDNNCYFKCKNLSDINKINHYINLIYKGSKLLNDEILDNDIDDVMYTLDFDYNYNIIKKEEHSLRIKEIEINNEMVKREKRRFKLLIVGVILLTILSGLLIINL